MKTEGHIILLGFATVAAIITMGIAWASDSKKQEIIAKEFRDEAIKRGYAELIVIDENQTEFRWKEKVDKVP